MKKAFSLVELMVALALLALVTGIILVSYKNLRDNAQKTLQDRDQVVLQRVLDSFHLTGGNLATILANASLSDQGKAQALTEVLQGSPGAVSRVQRGMVDSPVSTSNVLVPYSANDGRQRLVFSNGALVIKNSGTGFVVVASNSALGKTVTPASGGSDADKAAKMVLNSTDANNNSTLKGAKFASGEKYVWNEDKNVQGAPAQGKATTASVTVPPPTVPVPLGVAYYLNSSDTLTYPSSSYALLSPAGNRDMGTTHMSLFTYNGKADFKLFFYRPDGVTLNPSDVTVTMAFAPTQAGDWKVLQTTSSTAPAALSSVVSVSGVRGVLVQLTDFNEVRPFFSVSPQGYSQLMTASGHVPVSIKIAPTVSSGIPSFASIELPTQPGFVRWANIGSGDGSVSLSGDTVADPTPLTPPVINVSGTSGSLAVNDTVTVDATINALFNPYFGGASVYEVGNVGLSYSTDGGSSYSNSVPSGVSMGAPNSNSDNSVVTYRRAQ